MENKKENIGGEKIHHICEIFAQIVAIESQKEIKTPCYMEKVTYTNQYFILDLKS